MVSNAELNSRVESLSQQFDETKKVISELKADMDETKTGMRKLLSTPKDKDKIADFSSSSASHHQALNAAPTISL